MTIWLLHSTSVLLAAGSYSASSTNGSTSPPLAVCDGHTGIETHLQTTRSVASRLTYDSTSVLLEA